MNTEIWVGLISFAGIVITAFITKDTMSREIDKKVAVMEEKMDNMDKSLNEHNHYAKLYAETMPCVQLEIKQINKRLEKMEKVRGN